MDDPNAHDTADLVVKPSFAFVSLEGNIIEAIANQMIDSAKYIPSHFIENRIKRDGHAHHHVTVINSREIKAAVEAAGIDPSGKKKVKLVRELVRFLVKEFGDAGCWEPPVGLGVAEVKQDHARAFYHVLHWPFGDRIRKRLGLGPSFFHITVGFEPTDVHGLYKGPGTLLLFHMPELCQEGDIRRLLDLVPHYRSDEIFLRALARHCALMGYHEIGMTLEKSFQELMYEYANPKALKMD
ncbi:hypothetical protein BX666DRAFT_2032036 [Dichotomocladium elegans]|nr:hypothetical protein BX666DRAFT_2032036 [Dichotomocladium elegans]